MYDLESCGFSPWVMALQEGFYYFAYNILTPIYLFMGLTGNFILLAAFHRQSKKETAYAYQVFLTISKTLEILSFSTFLISYKLLAGSGTDGVAWFRNSYFLMYITARLGASSVIFFMICSLLFSVAMAADRVFALSRPFVYKNIRHGLHQGLAALICISWCFVICVSECWRFDLSAEGSQYQIVVFESYLNTTTAVAFGHTRAITRLSGIIILVMLCVWMTIAFRARIRKVAQMTAAQQKEQTSKAAEKTLLLLNVYQALLMCCNQIPHVSLHIMIFLWPSFSRCGDLLWAPICDGAVMVTDTLDFFIVMAINKRMRSIVTKAMPARCCRYGQMQESTAIGNIVPLSGVQTVEPRNN